MIRDAGTSGQCSNDRASTGPLAIVHILVLIFAITLVSNSFLFLDSSSVIFLFVTSVIFGEYTNLK